MTELRQVEPAKPVPSLRRTEWAAPVALAFVLVAMALVRYWRTPAEAGMRLVAPDGAEYAVSAHRLATLGTLDIDVGGTRYPIRYPPTFSALLLAPVYAVAPGEIGNGIVVVQGFALLLAAAACVAGHSLGGFWGAAAAGVAVIQQELLARFARTIMTDLPVAGLTVVALAVFLRLTRHSSVVWWGLAGFVAALATGLRPFAGVLLFPFLAKLAIERRGALTRLAALLAPMAMLVVTTAWYNHERFGAWNRTGYHFWCPIPYEFPSLTFNVRYFWDNFDLLASSIIWPTLVLGGAGAVVLFRQRHSAASATTAFVATTALPISLVHLYYFHVEPRFHAPLLALCCVIGAAGVVRLVPHQWRGRPWPAVVLAAVALCFVTVPQEPYGGATPLKSVFPKLAAVVPPGGTIITRSGPVHLDPVVLRPGQRHWVPIWRFQDYAGYAIAPKPIDLPASAVAWPGTHRAPALFEAGGRDPVPWTALERPDLIAARVAEGPGVYLDATSVPVGSEPYKRVAQWFELRPVDPEGEVLRLSLRPGGPTGEPPAE